MADEKKVTRVPVKFNYTGLNWDFLKLMAEIVPYADEKYTSFAQYTHARLVGQASPENHMAEHLRQYMMDEPYDHFDGDRGRHLVAIAYNAMMEWYYLKKFGDKLHPLKILSDGALLSDAEIASLAAAELAEVSGVDWSAGLAHYHQRWQDGLEGARDPKAMRRWKAMIWVIEQFVEVGRTSDVILPLIEDIKKGAYAQIEKLKSPENIEECQAKIAACETLRHKIPEMFPGKAE